MQEAPIYFKGPTDEVDAIDPYEEFEVKEDEAIEETTEDRLDDSEIVLDTEEEELNIDDVVDRSGETLTSPATEIKDLSDDVISEIEDGVNESISENRDYFHDLDGVKNAKDQFLDFTSLKNIISAIQSVYGKICVNGINDVDITNPIAGSGLKDLLNNGLFDFANCFLAEVTVEGFHDNVQDSLIGSGSNILSSDSMSSIDWVNSALDPGSLSLFGSDFGNASASRYVRPPSATDAVKELLRIEDNMGKINGNWFSESVYRTKNKIEVKYETIDTIKHASKTMKEVLEYSDDYIESLIVTENYDKETEFNNYPFSI